MFFFCRCWRGAIGRATEVQLNTLRRKLGVGCDPCFDYSVQQLAETLQEEEDEDDLTLDINFLDLLKRVNADTSEETQNKILAEDAPRIPGTLLRKKQDEKRPSSAFKTLSREDVQKRDAKASQGPPVGSYSPKADCLASFGKVKHPTPKVLDFGAYLPKGSENALLSSSRSENGPPNGMDTTWMGKRQVTFVNMAKQIPRPDLLNNLPPNDPQANDPEGVLYGHLKCARFGRFYRQPCFEFGTQPRQNAIAAAGGTSNPGEYEVKLNIIKPTITCHSFSNIPRPDFVASNRITDHLPDRSLARDCRSLTRFGRLLSPPVSVPRFDAPAPAAPARPRSASKPCGKERTFESLESLNSAWAWPTRQAPKTLGISVSHESETTCRPRSAPQHRVMRR